MYYMLLENLQNGINTISMKYKHCWNILSPRNLYVVKIVKMSHTMISWYYSKIHSNFRFISSKNDWFIKYILLSLIGNYLEFMYTFESSFEFLKRVGVTCRDSHPQKVDDRGNLEDVLAIETLISGRNLFILVWFVWKLN